MRPNNDTLYSFVWLDLHAEPMVLGVPEIKDERYYSFQLVDLYTHNFGYIGSRTTGFGRGYYLIAGSAWKGEKPAGVTTVFRTEGNLVYGIGRTAVKDSADVPKVLALQKQYTLTPLSKFMGQAAPKRVPIAFPPFDQKRADGAGFIGYFNFLLGQLEPHPSEKALLEKFATIEIGPKRGFNPAQLQPEIRKAIEDGIAAATPKIAGQKLGQQKNGWTVISMKNDWKRIFAFE